MRLHRDCITDRETRAMWRDYRALQAEGNPLGLSFAEYVASRVGAARPIVVVAAITSTNASPFYVSTCGHKHPWGASCNSWTAT